MSEQNTAGFWRRFVDKLAGGPPNREKLEQLKGKRWYVKYNTSLVIMLAILAIGILPVSVSRLNQIPDFQALQPLSVRILQTFETDPHLLVELPDGTQRHMEMPVPINGGLNALRYNGWSKIEREGLMGCLAEVRGVQLRFTLRDRYRVWELRCPEKKIVIDMDRTIPRFLSSQNTWEALFKILMLPLFIFQFVVFLREKRGTL